MKRSKLHLFSYMAALVIGAVLFAVLWKWLVGSASSTVVIVGIAGVVIAVSVFCSGMNSKSQMILTVNG
jgi:hypothetical protein